MNTEKTGTFIAELRREKELKQSELAEMIHVSDKAVSRWETGRGFPDINNLEALSECLGVSVAELLRGEKMSEEVTVEELRDITSDSISLAKTILNRSKYVNTLLGFITGLMIVIVAAVHMVSPVYCKDAAQALKIEELSDGKIVAVLNEDVDGYNVSRVNEPDSGGSTAFISCYSTKLDRMIGKKNNTLVMIGDKDEIDRVYYYPADGEDDLIYGTLDNAGYAGVVTLPRLIFNDYLVIGIIMSLFCFAAYIIFRRKHRGYLADNALRVMLMFVAFTVSIPLCLFGRMDEVYNASYYFSGILLTAVVIYAIFRIILYRRKGI